ncbi:unnamed protein product [Lasius platythorax]|uniref:Uncharacterized protein n=1 Tax=Lasius platythorax TaxID=488582 RepID=A0AAV2MZQ9_9HYME
MSHLEQHGPIEEMRQLTTQPQKTTAPTPKVTSKRPGLTPSTSMTTLVAPAPVQNLETSNVLQQMLEAIQQQHQQLDRLYQLLADQRSETSRPLAGTEQGGINPSSARSTPSEETSRRTAEFVVLGFSGASPGPPDPRVLRRRGQHPGMGPAG